MSNTLVLDDIVTDLEPSLEALEAALADFEVEMKITATCLCTIKCGNGLTDAVSV
jgi:hypothetical protein